MNLPFYEAIEPVQPTNGKIKMIHHGHAAKYRRIENMIKLVSELDSRFELNLMLVGMDSYYGKYLKTIATHTNAKRIRFLPVVRMHEIPRTINSYDIGLYMLAPSSFNQKMALPNKIFEYIQGRLALATWPSQEMVRIIDKYQNGIYSENFDIKQMARLLNRLTASDIWGMKRNSHFAAQKLHAEYTRKQLLEIVNVLLN
jgi:hypothetical protein